MNRLLFEGVVAAEGDFLDAKNAKGAKYAKKKSFYFLGALCVLGVLCAQESASKCSNHSSMKATIA